MNIEWRYNNYNFELKISDLRRSELDKIIDFLERLEKEEKLK